MSEQPSHDRPIDPRLASAIHIVFLVSIALAPLIAWLFGIEYGLAVMAFTLGVVTYLLREASRLVTDPARGALLGKVAVLTGILTVIAVVLLVVCLTAG